MVAPFIAFAGGAGPGHPPFLDVAVDPRADLDGETCPLELEGRGADAVAGDIGERHDVAVRTRCGGLVNCTTGRPAVAASMIWPHTGPAIVPPKTLRLYP